MSQRSALLKIFHRLNECYGQQHWWPADSPFEVMVGAILSQNTSWNNVEKAICIGTDKAVSPLNTYGATKLLMEKLFVTAQRYSNPKKHRTIFSLSLIHI